MFTNLLKNRCQPLSDIIRLERTMGREGHASKCSAQEAHRRFKSVPAWATWQGLIPKSQGLEYSLVYSTPSALGSSPAQQNSISI